MNDQSDLHVIRLLLGQMQIEIALLKRRVKDLEGKLATSEVQYAARRRRISRIDADTKP